jgi:hypothetical protein
VPRLLQQIYKAEMIYSAQQPEGNFVCDGTLLPGSAGKFDWKAADNASLKKYLRIDYYNINLDCPNGAKPRSFRVNAISNEGYILAPHISIDETGQLRVESEGADRSPSVR